MMWIDFSNFIIRFALARKGNVAQIFALAIIPIILSVGATIDFQRAVVERTYLQKSLDAAALAGGRAYLLNASKPKSVREKAAMGAAKSFFEASVALRGNRIANPVITVSVSKSNEIVTSGTAEVEMLFGGLVGLNKMAVNTHAEAMADDTRIIEIAMMLDNTASMFDNGRFTTMRNAAMNFVDTMFDQSPSADLVKIGVVPWSVLVNIKSEASQASDNAPYAHADVPVYGSKTIPALPSSSRISNLTWPTKTSPLSASALKTMFAPVGWRGCIRNAPSEIKTSSGGGVSKPITDAAVPGMRWPAGWVPAELQNKHYKTAACSKPKPEREHEDEREHEHEHAREREHEDKREHGREREDKREHGREREHADEHGREREDKREHAREREHEDEREHGREREHEDEHDREREREHEPKHNKPKPQSGPQGRLDWPGLSGPQYAAAENGVLHVDAQYSIARPTALWPGPASTAVSETLVARLTLVGRKHGHENDDEDEDNDNEHEHEHEHEREHEDEHRPEPGQCGKEHDSGYLSCWQDPKGWQRNTYIPKTQACSKSSNKPGPTGTVKACVSDPNEFAWISHGGRICPWQKNILPWTSNKGISGPNLNCPTAMLPLSSNRTQIQKKLEHMYPVPGGTQVYLGLLWGLRTLSPRSAWRSFWGQSGTQAARPWDPKKTRKIAILLTDGENVAPFDFEGALGCNDTERGSAGPCWKHHGASKIDQKTLDNLTLATCRAMTNSYDIELFTIAVDINNRSAIHLLEKCAGDPKRAFNIHSAQLDDTLQAIAKRALRLSK